MTFSFYQASANYYMQINRDARYTKDGIDDDFDEGMFPNDNEHGTGDPGEENDSIDDDQEFSNPFDDDSAPFDFDEEDVEQEEPDYDQTGEAADDWDEPIGDEVEEDEPDDDGNEQDPSQLDVHDENDVQQETDVRREIEQEDDIDQTEETVIDEPLFYPDDDDFDVDPTDEEEELQTPEEHFIENEAEEDLQDYPSDEIDDAFEYFNSDFVENEVPVPVFDEAQEEIVFEDFYEPSNEFLLDTEALDIHDPFDDVFANIFPDETLGDDFFQTMDNDGII